MFRKLVSTSDDSILMALRLCLGVVFFAHGAQFFLGWFGGYGFTGTMAFFTQLGFPAPLAFLAITSQFFGGIALLLGLLTRLAALGIIVDMLVAIATIHLQFGFFMNWTGQAKGEGFEFHLLVLAIAGALVVRGAGAWSIDRLLSSKLVASTIGTPAAKLG
jgi:putative oxidoreductase